MPEAKPTLSTPSPAAAFSGGNVPYTQPPTPPPASNANDAPPTDVASTDAADTIMPLDQFTAEIAARVTELEIAQARASDPRADLTPEDVLANVIGPDVARLALDALELHLRRAVIAPGVLGTVAFDGHEFVFLGVPVVDVVPA